MALFKDWQDFADQKSAQPDAQKFWAGYFLREKDFYAELLKSEPISGTVQALAERFGVDIVEMTGFLDGINESLKTALDLESLTAETEVSLDYDPEKLYYNMVAAKAEWLYTLPEWEPILTEEMRKAFAERASWNCGTGQGIIDWKKVFATCHEIGIDLFVVEREAEYGGLDRLTCLQNDVDWLKANL